MIKDFLNQVKQNSTFETTIYNGDMQIKGRILSPSEIKQANIASALLFQSLAKSGDLERLKNLQSEIENEEMTEEEIIKRSEQFLNRKTAEQMKAKEKNEELLIAQCVQFARMSDDEQWQHIQIVLNHNEQNNTGGRLTLWVGMIEDQDREKILDLAMKGHVEAVERLSTFRKQ